eukprot:TRINITY_DN2574_c1_g1_i1.p2 TRINITY_DN2574_c1_g1~~TRINITY_DN2574_c1_g1_i1.p2  ORF type:complete len:351 (-),score=31.81 TRINITY_DN2574_c1_g1_i1:214-1266(-)
MTRFNYTKYLISHSRTLFCEVFDKMTIGVFLQTPVKFQSIRRRRQCKLTALIQTQVDTAVQVKEGVFKWRNEYNIRYKQCGESGPVVLLVHGFGGNCDHWRKNLPELGARSQCYAIDLLGYGYSDKPDPSHLPPNSIYNIENWAQLLIDFAKSLSDDKVFLVCNSVGGVSGLQAAVMDPQLIQGVMVINISLRKLHINNQPLLMQPLVSGFQFLLRETAFGSLFFNSVAKKDTVSKILKQAYSDPDTVTDELVDVILNPGLQEGAAKVFLDFVSYSTGPLPDELLKKVQVPVSVVWGAEDPWEKVEWGREFAAFESVEEFIELPGVGHCPQDERPDLVNPLICKFVSRHT